MSQKSWSYTILFLRYALWWMQVLFFILGYCLLFYSPPPPLPLPRPPNSLNNENFKTMKETPGDIIISHKCTKNHDHMPHCSWDMVCEGCNCCFSFWAIFCLFTLLTARKMKISKQWKKYSEISSFYTSVPKIMAICYTVPET